MRGSAAITFVAIVIAPAAARGQSCALAWSEDYHAGDPLQVVRAQCVFDHGAGAHLYAGDRQGVWRWDGQVWTLIGEITAPGYVLFENRGVHALAVFDAGPGPCLIAGGDFTSIDGVAASHIARWDGTDWLPLGDGVAQASSPPPSNSEWVRALHVFDTGGSPALFAAGGFAKAGGLTASRVARWNGNSWSALGAGLGGTGPQANAYALASFNGSLYAGGGFTTAGGVTAHALARWNHGAWSPIGVPGTNARVRALTVFDSGDGSKLYVGGSFFGYPSYLARWDPPFWSALPSSSGAGVNGEVRALWVEPGTGGGLYVGGSFTTAGGAPARGIARYSDGGWHPAGAGLGGQVNSVDNLVQCIAGHDDGRGRAVFAGGDFHVVSGIGVADIARWTKDEWTAVGRERRGAIGFGRLEVADDGGGAGLYYCGADAIGGMLCEKLAKWDGTQWSAYPALAPWPERVQVGNTAGFDDGQGRALYVSWYKELGGGTTEGYVSEWTGSSWLHLPGPFAVPGTSAGVSDLVAYDDGQGEALYACGSFTQVGNVPALRIARWKGGPEWEALGTGISGSPTPEPTSIVGMVVFEGALHIGGRFASAGGLAVQNLARWQSGWLVS